MRTFPKTISWGIEEVYDSETDSLSRWVSMDVSLAQHASSVSMAWFKSLCRQPSFHWITFNSLNQFMKKYAFHQVPYWWSPGECCVRNYSQRSVPTFIGLRFRLVWQSTERTVQESLALIGVIGVFIHDMQ